MLRLKEGAAGDNARLQVIPPSVSASNARQQLRPYLGESLEVLSALVLTCGGGRRGGRWRGAELAVSTAG